MANPYHDETGRFCKREEMIAAMEKMASQNDFEQYYKLRKDLDQIDNDTVEISRSFLARTVNSFSNIGKLNSSEDIESLYSSIKDDESAQPGLFYQILTSPTTPETIKRSILQESNVERKIHIAEYIHRNQNNNENFNGTHYPLLMENETNPKLLHFGLESKYLTYEQKYEIAKRYPTGLAELATVNPRLFFKTPELVTELQQDAQKYVNKNSLTDEEKKEFLKIGKALTFADDEQSHQIAYEAGKQDYNEYGSVYVNLLNNDSLNPSMNYKILQYVALHDVTRLSDYTDLSGRARNEQTRSSRYLRAANDSARKPYFETPLPENLKNFIGSDFQAIQRNYYKTAHQDPDVNFLTRQAYFDAQKEQHLDLEKRIKAMSKRNAPDNDENGLTYRDYVQRREYATKIVNFQSMMQNFRAFDEFNSSI